MEVSIELPPKLIPLFTTPGMRNLVTYGGRGSAKTRTMAKMTAVRALELDQAGQRGIILCGREFMNSLDESSMTEIKEAILSEDCLKDRFIMTE
jgi:phage terminase large subunit